MLGWLFDERPFVTRSHCGQWPTWLWMAFIAGNLLIAAAYMTIPGALLALWHRRRREPGDAGMVFQPRMILLFTSFIALCGATHVAEVAVFWWAPYRFYTALLVVTGLVSGMTAIRLPAAVLTVLRLPGRELVHRLKDDLQLKVLELEAGRQEVIEHNEALLVRVRAMEGMLEQEGWTAEKAAELEAMRRTIASRLIEARNGGH